MKSKMLGQVLTAVLLLNGAAFAAVKQSPAVPKTDAEIAARVTHEIAMYPLYSMWDIVNVQVADGRVSLSGAVDKPFKKDEIESIAKETPGVTGVDSQIKVLPLSPQDDQLRLRIARALSRPSEILNPPPPISSCRGIFCR